MAVASNPTRFRFALLALVLTVIFALRQSGRIRDLEQQVNAAGANAAALEADLVAANEAREELAARQGNFRPGPAMLSADAASHGNSTETVSRGPGRRLRGLNSLMDDPEYQKAMLSQMRGGLDGRYASLFRKLKLPSAQLNQLKDLLVERQASTMDAFMAVRSSGGVSPGSGAMRSLVEETQSEIDAGIRELLGDDLYLRYEDYNANSTQYALADQLERRLSYTATPLTMDQADEFVRILNETQPASAAAAGPRTAISFVEESVGRGGPVGAANVYIGNVDKPALTDEAVIQAGDILTPKQLTALLEIQAEQLAQQKMFEAVRGSMGAIPPDGLQSDYTVGAPPPGG